MPSADAGTEPPPAVVPPTPRFASPAAATSAAAFAMLPGEPPQPYSLSVDVPYEPFARRLTALVRLVLALPVWLFIGYAQQLASLLGAFAWVAILVRGRYPAAMWRFNFSFVNWYAQAWGYFDLLTDEYPPLGPGSHAIRVRSAAYPVPEGETPGENAPPPSSSRWRAGLRLALVLPQLVILAFVNLAGFGALALFWIAIVFSGRRPDGLASFLAAVLRWNTRVLAYGLMLRDEYPPYSGAEEATTTGRTGEKVSLGFGALAVAGFVGLFALGLANQVGPHRETVSFEDAVAGDSTSILFGVSYKQALIDGQIQLYFTGGGADPAEDPIAVNDGRRLVRFTWELANNTAEAASTSEFSMTVVASGEEYDAFEVQVEGRRGFPVKRGDSAIVQGFFEVPAGVRIDTLTFKPLFGAQDIEVTFTR